jgi:hypothetical protein
MSANPSQMEPNEPMKFEIPKPRTGDEIRLTVTKHTCGVVVGKPKASWMGLEAPMEPSEVIAYQHWPMPTNESTKAKANRMAGQEKHYEIGSMKKIKELVEEVYKHLKDYGMDTIAYLPDPTDENRMTNCVLGYARLTTKTTKKMMLANRFQLYDSYNRKNDKEAVEVLLASVSDKL